MALDPSAPLVRSPDIIASEVDGELVLISIQDGKYFGLDPIGSEIWRLLEQPHTPAAVCETLQSQFDGDAAEIEGDAMEFMAELASHALLRAA
ncbi:PqqD family peptide modification chaperone [Sphingomonas sp. LB-2]|uniref:PqqD family peptide modification chaperone n=1 Tax=Sphingomonas caeni TaxID=2984949 RepID=UPI00223239B2|nr:PqqD family peptide modification chaperone [Sphingomonas caeni]MCW3847397.1 PqqD family peptide modification chaperone [Sphingomonas caeni]